MIKLNGEPINVTMFPDNTSQVWKLDKDLICCQHFNIEWEFNNESEFIHLAQLVDLIRSYVGMFIRINLKMPYLPYGRQDKDISNEATFSLLTFATLLNSLEFDRVTCLDPHSDVASKVIDNFIPIYCENEISTIISDLDIDLLCYPDKGALEKYKDMYDYPFLFGNKERNQLTGYIENYELIGNPKDRTILIVDDICDGGMTFKLLSETLLEKGAKEVNLFVSHGLFSKGLRTLKESGINKIFTAKGEASEYQNHIVYKPYKELNL